MDAFIGKSGAEETAIGFISLIYRGERHARRAMINTHAFR